MEMTLRVKIRNSINIFSCQCPLLILDGNNMVMIELRGVDTAINAIWAHIVKGKHEGNVTNVVFNYEGRDRPLYLPEKEKYLKYGFKNGILLYSKMFAEKERSAFLGGNDETPAIHFMEAFKMTNQEIPFLDSWALNLWKIAIQKAHITPLETISDRNMNAWKIKKGIQQQWKDTYIRDGKKLIWTEV